MPSLSLRLSFLPSRGVFCFYFNDTTGHDRKINQSLIYVPDGEEEKGDKGEEYIFGTRVDRSGRTFLLLMVFMLFSRVNNFLCFLLVKIEYAAEEGQKEEEEDKWGVRIMTAERHNLRAA